MTIKLLTPHFYQRYKENILFNTVLIIAADVSIYYHDSIWIRLYMKVMTVNFTIEHRKMLPHTKSLMESGIIVIDPRFEMLIISLKTSGDKYRHF